ncbi:MAG: signal peptidase I [Coriobacteriia bacterium]|nr:signal peptidase I [Coriobacteriia bacterium]
MNADQNKAKKNSNRRLASAAHARTTRSLQPEAQNRNVKPIGKAQANRPSTSRVDRGLSDDKASARAANEKAQMLASALTQEKDKSKRWPKEAPWNRKNTVFHEVVSFILTIALAVFSISAFKVFVADVYAVPTGSMSPTISVDDRIIAEKLSMRFSTIKQFDIVTFTDPVGNDRTLVKRVIAVEGQTINLINGFVYIDGIIVEEPYTLGRPSYPLSPRAGQTINYPYTVPPGYIWVMGDNRTDSADSRYFGPVSLELVTGRAIFITWPPDHFSSLK